MPNQDQAQHTQQPGLTAPFLQSPLWGQFQESIGNKAHHLSGSGWSCLLLEKSTMLGKYLFAPYGPVLASSTNLTHAIGAIRAEAVRLGADWLRFDPIVD